MMSPALLIRWGVCMVSKYVESDSGDCLSVIMALIEMIVILSLIQKQKSGYCLLFISRFGTLWPQSTLRSLPRHTHTKR